MQLSIKQENQLTNWGIIMKFHSSIKRNTPLIYTQQYEWMSTTMMLSEKASNKKYTVWLHLYIVQEQVKAIHSDRNQESLVVHVGWNWLVENGGGVGQSNFLRWWKYPIYLYWDEGTQLYTEFKLKIYTFYCMQVLPQFLKITQQSQSERYPIYKVNFIRDLMASIPLPTLWWWWHYALKIFMTYFALSETAWQLLRIS